MNRLPYVDVLFECFVKGKRLYTCFTQVAMIYKRDVLDKTSFLLLLLLLPFRISFWFWFFETNETRFFHCWEVSRPVGSWKRRARKLCWVYQWNHKISRRMNNLSMTTFGGIRAHLQSPFVYREIPYIFTFGVGQTPKLEPHFPWF
jgi:hypothetical protein